jgi:hypothetical protein
MATRDEVFDFLRDFKVKMDIFRIIFRDDRKKNSQALLDLDITKEKRKEIIKELNLADFSQGPLDDELYGIASMWVFGKTYRGHEIFIKISMGRINQEVICISFHTSEHPMAYPFKDEKI